MTPDSASGWVTYGFDQIVAIVTAWPPVIAITLVLLRNEVRQVANALAKRVLNPEQPFSFAAGPVHAEFPGRVPSDAETKAALPLQEPEIVPDNDALGDLTRALAESESRASFWHFAFLSRYLTAEAIGVVRFSRLGPTPLERVWEVFNTSISVWSRGVTLGSLIAHELVALDAGTLTPTDRGGRFLEWLARPLAAHSVLGLTPPLIAYGDGLTTGSIVEVTYENRVTSRTIVDQDGHWLLSG